MAYGRRFRKRTYRRNYRRNNRNKGEATWGQVAQKALKTAKWVAGLVNSEYKYTESTQATQAAIDYNGLVYNLCAPAQGDGATNRNGDSIKLKNLTLRGDIAYNGTTPETVRMMIINDKENSITTGSDILEYTGVQTAPYSPKNPNYKYDSKIIYDKTMTIDSQIPLRKFDIVLKLNHHMNFLATTTTIVNNSLKLLVIGQTSNGSLLRYLSKVTFIDN